MEKKELKEITRIPRSQGILGQKVFFIKNGNFLWSLRDVNKKLLGRRSKDLGQTWEGWQELVYDFDGYFSFTVNNGNDLHLVCKNSMGHIVYVFWKESDCLVEVLGENYLEKERLTYQTVLVNNDGQVHLIYFTDDPLEGIWRIKYSKKNLDGWSLPEILDYGIGPGHNQGAAALDYTGKIHLIYQVRHNKAFQFVYRERDEKSGSWSNKKIITSSSRSNLYPSLVIDENGTLHLTWLRSDGMNYRVMYRRKTRGGWMVGGWQKDQIISASGVNAYTPTIGIIDDKVVSIWQQTDGIYQAISCDQGQTFSEPVLQEKYQKLAYKNLISLDFYHKPGWNIMSTIDTGSTSVALLTAVFSNEEDEKTKENFLNLPELKENQEMILPSFEFLSIDYGQKGLEKYLQKINGNFQRLLFETEDIRLTNLQMQETIRNKEDLISDLQNELQEKEEEIKILKVKEQTLEKVIDKLKKNTTKTNMDFQEKQKLMEKNFQDLEKTNIHLKEKLVILENTNLKLLKQLEEQKIRILKSEEREKKLKEEIEKMKNLSFWERLLGR